MALKFLPPHLADLKDRFLVEAQAAAFLSHPNICVIHEIEETEDRPFIAMEYIHGDTLRDRIRRKPPTTAEALAKKPSARYQTMEELTEDLEAVADGLKPIKARPARAIKLAILPFANLSGDPEQEYLSDGLTQEMISQLGRLHPESLSVIARTSVIRFKKGDTSVDQIGQELGVEYVLEGSARKEGSRARISADLIQVRDQVQLWGDVFEREMLGILALQNDVAREVAEALALKLLPSEQARLAQARPVNPEAYEAYLKGLQHWYKLTPAGIDASQQYFELALKKDPNCAPPVYSGQSGQ